jgi:hypothetical protein
MVRVALQVWIVASESLVRSRASGLSAKAGAVTSVAGVA